MVDVRRNWLDNCLRKAGTGKYQSILKVMAGHSGVTVPLRVIEEGLDQNQSQFSANMAILIERGVVERVDIGVYGFRDPLLREFIRRFGIRGVGDATIG